MIRRSSLLVGFFLLLVISSFLLLNAYDFTPEGVVSAVKEFGILAPIAFVLLLTAAIIVSQIPNIPIALAGGALFGAPRAAVLLFIAGVLGSSACFLIARFFRSFVLSKIGSKYSFLRSSSSSKIAWIVFISRLFPFLPFDVISYASGLTMMKFSHFVIATMLGMIPMILVFSYTGTLLLRGAVWPYIGLGIVLILTILLPLLLGKRLKEWLR